VSIIGVDIVLENNRIIGGKTNILSKRFSLPGNKLYG